MSARAATALPLRGRTAVLAVGVSAVLLPLELRSATNPLHFLLLAGFVTLLVALAACDVTTMLLPNRLMYPGIVAAAVVAGAWPGHTLAASLIGGAAGFGTMFAVFMILPGFGAGDVKLCGLIGLLVGWPAVIVAITVGVMCNGALVALGLVSGRLRIRGMMPYGPGLVTGALFVLLRAHS